MLLNERERDRERNAPVDPLVHQPHEYQQLEPADEDEFDWMTDPGS
jgi:hypothetical protein